MTILIIIFIFIVIAEYSVVKGNKTEKEKRKEARKESYPRIIKILLLAIVGGLLRILA